MPDPSALTTAVASAIEKEGAGFLSQLLGPPAAEIGHTLAERLRVWRLQSALRVAARAQEILRAAGVEPSIVPLKVLVPLLEGASLEEDGSPLVESWARLLASAANPRSAEVLPAFTRILSQLTLTDAEVLDFLFGALPDQGGILSEHGEELEVYWGINRPRVYEGVKSGSEEVEISIDNLVGLGLVEREPALIIVGDGLRPTDSSSVRLSSLGRRFVAACKAEG